MLFGKKFKGFRIILILEVRMGWFRLSICIISLLLHCVNYIFQQLLLLQMIHNLILKASKPGQEQTPKNTLYSSLKTPLRYLSLLPTLFFFLVVIIDSIFRAVLGS